MFINFPKIETETNFIWKKMHGLKRSVEMQKYESCINHKHNFLKKKRPKGWLNQ